MQFLVTSRLLPRLSFEECLLFPGGHRSVWITHLDRVAKLLLLRLQSAETDVFICKSRMTMEQLAAAGFQRRGLCYVMPAHDGSIHAPEARIGHND